MALTMGVSVRHLAPIKLARIEAPYFGLPSCLTLSASM
jgi:hypothetical protein